MTKVVLKYTSLLSFLLSPLAAWSLPIDWHGAFGVDTTLIDNYRLINKGGAKTSTNDGTQEVDLGAGNNPNATFQSYIFKLQPEMIVNDSATIKAEISSGYGRGGFLGEDSVHNSGGSFGNALYYQNESSGGNSIILNKVYAELYSDTATYQIGRHTSHWALGALINSGNNPWDRHSFSRDGITAKLKIGNFHIAPFWGNVSQGGSLSRTTKINETGISLLYDNKERDLSFGLFYGVKESAANDTSAKNGAGTNMGEVDVKVTDLYLKKKWGDFDIALEVPIMSGTLGDAGVGTAAKDNYKAKAFIVETNYNISDSMVIGLDAGQVDGDDGKDDSFSAMYLNPNYQIAKLMFRYNMNAVANPSGQNIYDSYIVNAMYFKLRYLLRTDRVDWKFAFIKAMASETSTGSGGAFNHTTNKAYTSAATQSDDMGMEIDISFDYHWNKEITIGGSAGYMLTGDYWSFTNDSANTHEADNAFALQLNTSIQF